MGLKSTDNRIVFARERLSRIAAELKETLDDLPSDLRGQVAIWSAIAFVELVLDHHLDDGRQSQPAARPAGIVPPRETT